MCWERGQKYAQNMRKYAQSMGNPKIMAGSGTHCSPPMHFVTKYDDIFFYQKEVHLTERMNILSTLRAPLIFQIFWVFWGCPKIFIRSLLFWWDFHEKKKNIKNMSKTVQAHIPLQGGIQQTSLKTWDLLRKLKNIIAQKGN